VAARRRPHEGGCAREQREDASHLSCWLCRRRAAAPRVVRAVRIDSGAVRVTHGSCSCQLRTAVAYSCKMLQKSYPQSAGALARPLH
jgi:hypothetical protein